MDEDEMRARTFIRLNDGTYVKATLVAMVVPEIDRGYTPPKEIGCEIYIGDYLSYLTEYEKSNEVMSKISAALGVVELQDKADW